MKQGPDRRKFSKGPGQVSVGAAKAADLPEVRELLSEYSGWIEADVCFEGFKRELDELPGDYVAPAGILLVARVGGEIAGSVGVHRWADGVCEMKRLFVKEAHRGSGCGKALVESVISWARETGYERILLDTLPAMKEAQRLYERLGFHDIPAYRPAPVPGARCMERVL